MPPSRGRAEAASRGKPCDRGDHGRSGGWTAKVNICARSALSIEGPISERPERHRLSQRYHGGVWPEPAQPICGLAASVPGGTQETLPWHAQHSLSKTAQFFLVTRSGEVCFNTSMTGYQEILTDPSYRGQILTMTAPQIGNYGVNPADVESGRLQMAGFIVREASRIASNFTATGTLGDYLAQAGVVGLFGIDTRALVRRLRIRGAMTGVLSSEVLDAGKLVALARGALPLVGRDLVGEVMPDAATLWTEQLAESAMPLLQPAEGGALPSRPGTSPTKRVVALDYGMKWNIARHLASVGCDVTVLPGRASVAEVMAHKPDGVFLSNGPGDPEVLGYCVDTVRGLIGKVPMFGICLGHQLLALACGAKTFKLKFGHRGANQPVMDLDTGKVEITSQNHGFAVDEETLPANLVVTHRNLNDGTIEGLRHRFEPAASVQYHPEAAAGPHDSAYLFNRFRGMLA
jgi:carbamoyl-phosphate synthase small subunit